MLDFSYAYVGLEVNFPIFGEKILLQQFKGAI